MNAARRWWPISSADVSRASTAVGTVLDAWAAEWIAQPSTLTVAGDVAAVGMGNARTWHSKATCVTVRLGERGWDRLLRGALDLPPGAALPIGGAALDVIEGLSRAMAADLVERLAGGLRLHDLAERRAAAQEDVADAVSLCATLDDGNVLLRLDADAPWLRDAFAPAALPSPPPAATRRAAIEGASVSLAAMVGSCDISAAEFAELSVGDVLVTGTPLDQPLRLSIGDGTTPFAKASPVRRDGRVALVLQDIH